MERGGGEVAACGVERRGGWKQPSLRIRVGGLGFFSSFVSDLKRLARPY